MKKIFLTGSSGFVGKNLISYFSSKFPIVKYHRNSKIEIKEDIVIHLAGKAHDLKKVTSPSDYYHANTELTKEVFDKFLLSDAKVFIFLSSVKSVADRTNFELNEDVIPNPQTHYGKSKLLAEQYLLKKPLPVGKRIYILRPCMIHGPGNKGNLNLLYKIIKNGFPWPLGSYENKRSFCSIDNLCFILNQLIENYKIPSGVYNVADDEPISTNELITYISMCLGIDSKILFVPKFIIKTFAKFGDFLRLPLNTERLNKLTETYIVSNKKIKSVINMPFPLTAKEGILKTIKSFR